MNSGIETTSYPGKDESEFLHSSIVSDAFMNASILIHQPPDPSEVTALLSFQHRLRRILSTLSQLARTNRAMPSSTVQNATNQIILDLQAYRGTALRLLSLAFDVDACAQSFAQKRTCSLPSNQQAQCMHDIVSFPSLMDCISLKLEVMKQRTENSRRIKRDHIVSNNNNPQKVSAVALKASLDAQKGIVRMEEAPLHKKPEDQLTAKNVQTDSDKQVHMNPAPAEEVIIEINTIPPPPAEADADMKEPQPSIDEEKIEENEPDSDDGMRIRLRVLRGSSMTEESKEDFLTTAYNGDQNSSRASVLNSTPPSSINESSPTILEESLIQPQRQSPPPASFREFVHDLLNPYPYLHLPPLPFVFPLQGSSSSENSASASVADKFNAGATTVPSVITAASTEKKNSTWTKAYIVKDPPKRPKKATADQSTPVPIPVQPASTSPGSILSSTDISQKSYQTPSQSQSHPQRGPQNINPAAQSVIQAATPSVISYVNPSLSISSTSTDYPTYFARNRSDIFKSLAHAWMTYERHAHDHAAVAPPVTRSMRSSPTDDYHDAMNEWQPGKENPNNEQVGAANLKRKRGIGKKRPYHRKRVEEESEFSSLSSNEIEHIRTSTEAKTLDDIMPLAKRAKVSFGEAEVECQRHSEIINCRLAEINKRMRILLNSDKSWRFTFGTVLKRTMESVYVQNSINAALGHLNENRQVLADPNSVFDSRANAWASKVNPGA